ncbi:peptidase domain-containing ABC transporter [Oculatella sp. LEGE 06141]|uniref:peptidase domain-containing ABC transporter n=1 Tax=Oculatella sp. LEGE 06141 TaxID=1828648 RepID=UPI001880D608|nr:peptidase domain-containing ABC transporter [Oculatella sp. LEGE 06141]MBE9180071.1 peptidase domain-containing ABC transporter [Oculatella sp. LEGE 06141]
MTYADTQINSYLSDFFEAWPFNHLSAKLRGQVASKLQLCSFRPGQVIYPPRELPSAVHCVVQGRVRILGLTSYQSPTLAVRGKGTVIGWDSLLRRVAVGSVRAALTASEPSEPSDSDEVDQEVLTLSLSADDFEAIAQQHLMTVLTEQASLAELFDTLSRFMAGMQTRFDKVNLKDVVQYIEREQLAVVQHWFPAANPKTAAFELPTDRTWLVSGGAPLDIPIGVPVVFTDQLPSVRSSPFPIRLIGIDQRFWMSTILGNTVPAVADVETAEPSSKLHLLPETPSLAHESPSSAFVPSTSSAIQPVSSGLPSVETAAPRSKDFPVWRSPAPTAVEDVVACFGMICERLQVPYRPDSLRRWLAKQSLDEYDPLDLCSRIAQAVGLNAEIVRFTPTPGGINRLATPAIVQCRDVFTVLHDVAPSTVVLASPRTGLLRLAPAQLASRLVPKPTSKADKANQSTSICRAIVLERLPQTPIKHFGFNWFLPVISQQRGVLIQVLVASLFVQLLGLGNPLLVQQIVDNVVIKGNIGAMTMFGILMIMFSILEAVLTVLRMHLFASTTHRVDLRLGSEIVRHMLHLPMGFFEKRPVGELSARLSELENIRQFLTGTALTAVLDVIFSLFYIAVMFLYSPQLTACVMGTVPVVIASTLFVAGIQRKLIRTKAEHSSKVQSYLIEVLGGIFTVKAQNMEALVEATWRERYVQYLSSGFTTATVNTIFSSFSNFLNTISSLLVLWVGAGLVIQGELTLGGLIAFRILTGYVTGPLLRLARLWQKVQETSLSMELLADIVEFPSEEPPQDEGQVQLPLIEGRVQFHGINFGFKPGQLQLSNVSLDIPAGSFVGIVGQSGSGKSTLMKLLPRLYLPHSGSISIDGYDVGKVNLGSLRRQVGIVPQDAVLFEGTIRDNIALFADLPDEEIIEAARVAEAHDFIMQLPEGYSTQVGERGASLSGGQRQRIAIARVVAREPRLLIFDEATSALDYETERRVCENLMRRFQDRTCFFITHRLTTIARADWILFMQTGVIAEQGKHTDLMARRQLYYCLYTQQSRL